MIGLLVDWDTVLLLQKAKDVVQDIETGLLSGKEEGLAKVAERATVVAHLTEDLDEDTIVHRDLAVHLRHDHFAVLKAKFLNPLLDSLKSQRLNTRNHSLQMIFEHTA